MAIPRKPTGSSETKPAQNERAIEALIEKGGSIATETAEPDEDKIQLMQLRLKGSLVKRIDESMKRRHPYKETRPPRHAWFVEAVLEKLAREEERA